MYKPEVGQTYKHKPRADNIRQDLQQVKQQIDREQNGEIPKEIIERRNKIHTLFDARGDDQQWKSLHNVGRRPNIITNAYDDFWIKRSNRASDIQFYIKHGQVGQGVIQPILTIPREQTHHTAKQEYYSQSLSIYNGTKNTYTDDLDFIIMLLEQDQTNQKNTPDSRENLSEPLLTLQQELYKNIMDFVNDDARFSQIAIDIEKQRGYQAGGIIVDGSRDKHEANGLRIRYLNREIVITQDELLLYQSDNFLKSSSTVSASEETFVPQLGDTYRFVFDKDVPYVRQRHMTLVEDTRIPIDELGNPIQDETEKLIPGREETAIDIMQYRSILEKINSFILTR